MGLDVNAVRFLLYLRSIGLDLSSIAMIGRQSLHLSAADLGRSLREFGQPADPATVAALAGDHGGYGEGLLAFLGAETVHSFDYSAYEGASHVHDMNLPIGEEHRGRYALVLDGGSLEHIFDFPAAVRNCMAMTRVGGHFLGVWPANNFMGHGFYQFSPELFYTVFSPENGFRVRAAIVYENGRRARWYRVRNPREVGRRVTLANSRPTYLLVLAEKLAQVEPFRSTPQQSDYLAGWDCARGCGGEAGREGGNAGGSGGGEARRFSGTFLARHLFKPLERGGKQLVRCFFGVFNPRFYRSFDPHRGRDALED